MVCHWCKTCDIHCDDGAYAATNYYEGQMTHMEAGEKRHVMWHAVTKNFSTSHVFPSRVCGLWAIYIYKTIMTILYYVLVCTDIIHKGYQPIHHIQVSHCVHVDSHERMKQRSHDANM